MPQPEKEKNPLCPLKYQDHAIVNAPNPTVDPSLTPTYLCQSIGLKNLCRSEHTFPNSTRQDPASSCDPTLAGVSGVEGPVEDAAVHIVVIARQPFNCSTQRDENAI